MKQSIISKARNAIAKNNIARLRRVVYEHPRVCSRLLPLVVTMNDLVILEVLLTNGANVNVCKCIGRLAFTFGRDAVYSDGTVYDRLVKSQLVHDGETYIYPVELAKCGHLDVIERIVQLDAADQLAFYELMDEHKSDADHLLELDNPIMTDLEDRRVLIQQLHDMESDRIDDPLTFMLPLMNRRRYICTWIIEMIVTALKNNNPDIANYLIPVTEEAFVLNAADLGGYTIVVDYIMDRRAAREML